VCNLSKKKKEKLKLIKKKERKNINNENVTLLSIRDVTVTESGKKCDLEKRKKNSEVFKKTNICRSR